MFRNNSILCISAHMDDIEFGCGGLIHHYADKADIHVLVLSADRKSFSGVIQEVRDAGEQQDSLKALGLKESHLFISQGIPGQLFPEYRQAVLEEMYRIDALINPDIVITPSIHDVHQDHRTTCRCAQKAFKRKSRLSYEIVNSTEGFLPRFFLELNPEDIHAKIKAVCCYKSQKDPEITTADYFDGDIMSGLARMRGARIGVEYAEAFEVMNIVCKEA